MDLGAADLPDDVETLRAMILAARARAAAAEAEIEQIRAEQAQLAAVENEQAGLLAQVVRLEAQN